MPCFYTYKGITFESELQLDDFLIESSPYKDVMKDTVFSTKPTIGRLNTEQTLGRIKTDAALAYQDFKNLREHNLLVIGEDGEVDFEKPPHYGVNKFLSGLTDSEGNLLFPEFRPDVYWEKNRYPDWIEGQFTDAEKQLFEVTDGTKITDPELHKEMRAKMEEKWKAQARTGDTIHNILEICFKSKPGSNVPNIATKTNEEIAHDIMTKSWGLSARNKLFIHGSVIEDTIKYARSLYESLVNDLDKEGKGANLMFKPEFAITLDANLHGNPVKLLGIIDLLVIDKDGRAHILDYKTSIHHSDLWSGPKTLSFRYQLATYLRMLTNYGVKTREGRMYVAPILIMGFRKEGDTYIYDGIKNDIEAINLSELAPSENMISNINEYMPETFVPKLVGENVGEEVSKVMAKWAPTYSNTRIFDEKGVKAELERKGLLKKNESGEYSLDVYGEEPITATTDTEFIQKVLTWKKNQVPMRLLWTINVKLALKGALSEGIDSVTFPTSTKRNLKASLDWLKNQLSKYCDGNWEIVDNEVLEDYGIIHLRTKASPNNEIEPRLDFIKITTDTVDIDYRLYRDRRYKEKDSAFNQRKGLSAAAFGETDVVEKSKQGSMMLQAVNGNVELMEAMLVLNQMDGFGQVPIGEISIVNPLWSNGLKASNEELLYCFTEMNRHFPVTHNKYASGEILFATKFDIVRSDARHYLYAANEANYKDHFKHAKKFKSAISTLDDAVNGDVDTKIAALLGLLKSLENPINKMEQLMQGDYTTRGNANLDLIDLRNEIHLALAQLKGINFRLQLKDHDEWLESIFILTQGAAGSRIDNPGNLNSETLNLITKLTTDAYQNIRDDVQRRRKKIFDLVLVFKALKMNSIVENTVGNQAAMYSNFYKEVDGDWYFKKPSELVDPTERALLEYALEIINEDRIGDNSNIDELKEDATSEYYQVPLCVGGSDSDISERGFMTAVRHKLSYFYPPIAWKRAREKAEGIFNADEDYARLQSSLLLYKMSNQFNKSNDQAYRKKAIKEKGLGYFEHNLETILYKHSFSYSALKNIDNIFPLIRAAIIHILQLGIEQNTTFSLDLKYAEDYIRSKVLNLSIVNPKLKTTFLTLSLLRLAASLFTLAFSPILALYLSLQSLWVDVSLMIRKPDGKNSFTFEHFRKAFGIAYKDLGHFSDKPTLCSLLNETFGLNDMDMNQYADRLSTGKKGIWNFLNFAMKFASRPDYYSRLTIFLSLMQGDGCLDAVSLKDGQLHYDQTKDKRFAKYLASPNATSGDAEWTEQRAKYYAIARQFEIEGAKNADGTVYKFDPKNVLKNPLPRVYTTKEAESMKSLADDIYGYYSHEKKSLVMSMTIGSMWLLFKTYWSGKKNLYLLSGGVRLRGQWKPYTETVLDEDGNPKMGPDGKPLRKAYYYLTREDGTIDYSKPPLAEGDPNLKNTNFPVVLWDGLWLEGIILTLSDMAKQLFSNKSFKEVWNSKWNNSDEKLLLAYRNNLKLFAYDMILFFIIGSLIGAFLDDWLAEKKKGNAKSHDFGEGLKVAAANVAVMSVKNSFLDFNFIDSIGSPLTSWNPFAFEWGARQVKNVVNVATGDLDFWDGVVNTSTALKSIKPALNTIKPDCFRTVREGGTFGKE